MARRELFATPALAAFAAPALPEICHFTEYLINLNYSDSGKALRRVSVGSVPARSRSETRKWVVPEHRRYGDL